MNKPLLLSLIFLSLFLSGCYEETQYSSDYYGSSDYNESSYSEECIEPENPYNDGGGHDAGYNRAEEKDVSSCGGNSESFIEGCEEYLAQQDDYDSCLNS